jgi:5-methylcytosine-specific restriction endonuclease McrA
MEIKLKQCSKCGEWKPETPEYFRRSHSKFRSDCKSCANEYDRLYYATHSEEAYERKLRSYFANPKRHNEYSRRYYALHAKESNARSKNYRNQHPEKIKEYDRKRRSLKAKLPVSFNNDDEKYALEYFHGYCAVCNQPLRDLFGDRMPHMDHWIALTDPRPDNPGTVPWNMVPLCNQCNSSKGSHDPHDWLIREYGSRYALNIENRVQVFFSTVRKSNA